MPRLFEFVHFNPTQIHFGPSSISHLPDLIPADARVLMLYGGGSIKANGVHAQLMQALADRTFVEFSGVEPNPTLRTLQRAVQQVREQRLDFVLAVGGGSCIDGGKFVAAAALYDGDGWDLVSGKRPVTAALPIGAVLTLAATGSESNGGAVVTDAANRDKRVFFSPLLFPRFAIMDPLALTSLPDRQLANGVVDAFVHVCEQYLTSDTGAPVQEGYAEALLRTLRHLAETFECRREPGWLQNLMWAANQALCGIIGVGMARDFATHAISRHLTALYGIDHARALSILHASVLRETAQAKAVKLRQMGLHVFGLTAGTPQDTIAAIEAMYRRIGMPTHLRDTGLQARDVAQCVLAGALHDLAAAPHSPVKDLDEQQLRRVVAASCGAP